MSRFILALCVMFWTPFLSAQFSGAIQGTVVDSTQAAVPDAVVAAVNVETGIARVARTSNEGFYRISNLAPGTYNLKVEKPGFLGFELGADGGGGIHLSLPGSGSRSMEEATGNGYVHMNGREVFKFATRVLVSSAQALLDECDVKIEDVDLYVPHQANVRIMDHAVRKLGIPADRMVVNVDRYGNTSSGSIPLALADAQADGRLQKGDLVLMTGMGAGLTWGSALMEWTL